MTNRKDRLVLKNACIYTGNTDARTDSPIYAESISERRCVTLSAISGQGPTDWRWQCHRKCLLGLYYFFKAKKNKLCANVWTSPVLHFLP